MDVSTGALAASRKRRCSLLLKNFRSLRRSPVSCRLRTVSRRRASKPAEHSKSLGKCPPEALCLSELSVLSLNLSLTRAPNLEVSEYGSDGVMEPIQTLPRLTATPLLQYSITPAVIGQD